MSSLGNLDLCRLCLVKDRVSVPIFEGEGDVRQIFLKITACLPVKVNREDKLPKKICDDCVYKVELCYQFWHTTANAEKQLLQWLGEVNMEDKQGYNVLNPNGMKEQNNENRLDGTVMQEVSEHQNNMNMGMMDNIGLSMPIMMSSNAQQQITSVPMDNSGSSVQNVQPVAGPSTQTTHDQITQNQTDTPTQQEEEEESSEEEENSDDECDGDEGLPIKEESEEDPNNSRTIEPTTFVNVSLACDEAGPSGLQQQKIADMPEMVMSQTADVDPKTGSEPCDPLQQNYLVIKNDQQYYLVPIQDSCFVKNEGKSEIVEPPCPSPKVKVEVADESMEESEEIYKNVKDELNLASEIHNENLKYTCPYCWLKFDKNCNLKNHVMIHSNVYPHECSICSIRLETKTLLTSHVLLHESDVELFHCTDCDFKSTKASSVTCHQVKWHANIYKCQFCFEIFQNKVIFLQHMELHNAVTICDVCNQVCEDNCHLTQHKRKHQDDKSYIHTELYKQLQREDERQNDEKQANIKKCELEKFDLQERFNRLNWNLSLPTEKKFFKCSQCKWSFRTMSLLNKHTKRHSRNFKCNECNAVFKYKASFLKHKYKHEVGDDDEDEYNDEDEDEY